MLAQLTNLLDEFRQLPVHPKHLPTLMEIAGCAHKENECSNILAFFLDSGSPHGLGTLFLDAIAQIGGIQNQGGAIDSNLSVEREVTTDKGNRIDILIQSDSHVIVIENKIFAPANNPFPDYATFAETLKPQGRHISKFLLTRTPNNAGCAHGFRNVRHGEFVNQIRVLLGQYVAGAETRYLTFMLDFLNTLDYLQRGMVMDPDFREFLARHLDDVETLVRRCYQFKATDLRSMVGRLRDRVGDVGVPRLRAPLLGSPSAEDRSLVDELRYFITCREGFEVNVRAIVSPTGWEIRIGQTDQRLNELLTCLRISHQEQSGRQSFLHERFGFEEDISRIAEIVRHLVVQLAGWQS